MTLELTHLYDGRPFKITPQVATAEGAWLFVVVFVVGLVPTSAVLRRIRS